MDNLVLDLDKPPQMEVDAPNLDLDLAKAEDTGSAEVSSHESPRRSRSPTQSDDGLRGGRRSTGLEVVATLGRIDRGLETNMDRLTLAQLKEVMDAGGWAFHEILGAPVCASVTSRDKREGDDCGICLDYVEHVCNGIRDNEGSLDAALKLRTHWLTMTHREGDQARLEGEICAVRRVLRERETELRTQRTELIEVSAARLACKTDAKKAWEVVKDFKKRVDKLEAELKDAHMQMDRVDESRSRKTPHVAQQGSNDNLNERSGQAGSKTITFCPQAPSEEDIVMAEVRQPAVEVDWENMKGIPRMVVQWPYSGVPALPPPKATWSIKNFVPTTLPAYLEAYQFMHDYVCYPVGLAVFGEYVQARTDKTMKKDLTDIQQWALEHFQLPSWMWAIFQCFNVDANALAENRQFWQIAKMPGFGDDIRVLAAFIQKSGCPPEGLEFRDEFGTLDSQLLRGFQLWNGISAPKLKGYSSNHQQDSENAWSVTRALLYVVLYPQTYPTTLRLERLTIADEVNVQQWVTKEAVTEDQAIRRLARMGVTVPMVEDMYRYALNLAESLVASSKKGCDLTELRDIIEGSKQVVAKLGGPPVGLGASHDEFIPRPPGLPWPDSHMNKVQERGVFLRDIPLRVEGGGVQPVTLQPLPVQLTGPRIHKPNPKIVLKTTPSAGGKEKAVAPVVVSHPKDERNEGKRNAQTPGARYAQRGASRGRGGFVANHQARPHQQRNAVASTSRRSPPHTDERQYSNHSASNSIYTSRYAPAGIHPNSMQSSMHAPPLMHEYSYPHPYAPPHHPASAFPPHSAGHGPSYPTPGPGHHGAPSSGSWSNAGSYSHQPSSGQYAPSQQLQQPIQFGTASMYAQGGGSGAGTHAGNAYDESTHMNVDYQHPGSHHHPQ
ncbi:hypothetical protein DFH06DRAFT_1294212 [Mycena polygramma]|nr:hypothetical protein DFH06DRAFT_1307918 [Mycena polygramma]KAJ7669436.1 hypothetical protein DFH06DRAFT_1294212 [Mycena polygramma]